MRWTDSPAQCQPLPYTAHSWLGHCGKVGMMFLQLLRRTVTTELESKAVTVSVLSVGELDFRHKVTITCGISWVGGRIPSGRDQATDWRSKSPLSHFSFWSGTNAGKGGTFSSKSISLRGKLLTEVKNNENNMLLSSDWSLLLSGRVRYVHTSKW